MRMHTDFGRKKHPQPGLDVLTSEALHHEPLDTQAPRPRDHWRLAPSARPQHDWRLSK